MKKAILFSLFIFTSVFTYSAETWLAGNWEGKGIQVDGMTWGIKLTVTDMNQVKVEYADLKCGGVWNLTGSKGKKIYYTERIEQGAEFCDQGVELTVKQQGIDEIKITFVLKSFHPSKPIATAILKG
jgi:hypothetical protein